MVNGNLKRRTTLTANTETIITFSGNEVMFSLVRSTGSVNIWAGVSLYQSRPYSCWVEYTKS